MRVYTEGCGFGNTSHFRVSHNYLRKGSLFSDNTITARRSKGRLRNSYKGLTRKGWQPAAVTSRGVIRNDALIFNGLQPYYHIAYTRRQGDKLIFMRTLFTYPDARKAIVPCARQNLTDIHAPGNRKRDQLADAPPDKEDEK